MFLLVCLLAAIPFLLAPAQAAAGDLDPSFGTGGKVITDFGPGSNSASAVATQLDGRVVAVGRTGSGDFGLARFLVDGSLDPSFGSAGKVTTDVGGAFDEAFAVMIQPDGKIVAAGGTAPGGGCCQFALARYNPDGSLDPTFDTDGKVTTPFGGDARAFDVAIQADGKILAAGSKFDPFENGFALARYNPDGSLDPTFGTAGKALTSFGGMADAAHGVAVQPDGKIIAAGAGGAANDFLVARYNPDGSLDATFGTTGKVITDFGGLDRAHDVDLQGDGKIVAAGVGGEKFAVARYRTDGSLDPSFDGDGKATTQFTGENIEIAEALAIQPEGRIVVAGSAFTSFDRSYALARFNAEGSLDATFGTGGKVMTNFGNPSDVGVLCPEGRPDCSEDIAYDVATQPDGKIVAVGGGGACNPPCAWTLARYLVDSPPSSTTTTTAPPTTTTTTTLPPTTTTTTLPVSTVCGRLQEARDRVLAHIDQVRHALLQNLSGPQFGAALARLDQVRTQVEASFALARTRAGCTVSTGGASP
jgi:uncharacterized delta-60 repeat protein